MFSIIPMMGVPSWFEHINAFAGVEKCYVLWRRDDDRTVQVGLLSKCHLHVARARRKIDDQHVKRAPLHLAQHLLQGPHEHRAAPDHGLIFVGHQAERHHGHAKVAHRQDDFAIRRGGDVPRRRACAAEMGRRRLHPVGQRVALRRQARKRGWTQRLICPRRPCQRLRR